MRCIALGLDRLFVVCVALLLVTLRQGNAASVTFVVSACKERSLDFAETGVDLLSASGYHPATLLVYCKCGTNRLACNRTLPNVGRARWLKGLFVPSLRTSLPQESHTFLTHVVTEYEALRAGRQDHTLFFVNGGSVSKSHALRDVRASMPPRELTRASVFSYCARCDAEGSNWLQAHVLCAFPTSTPSQVQRLGSDHATPWFIDAGVYVHAGEALPYFGAGITTTTYAKTARARCFNATGHCLQPTQPRNECPCVTFCCESYQLLVCPSGQTAGFAPQLSCSWRGHTRDNYPPGYDPVLLPSKPPAIWDWVDAHWATNAETFERTGGSMNGVFAVSVAAVLEWPKAAYAAAVAEIEASGTSGGSA